MPISYARPGGNQATLTPWKDDSPILWARSGRSCAITERGLPNSLGKPASSLFRPMCDLASEFALAKSDEMNAPYRRHSLDQNLPEARRKRRSLAGRLQSRGERCQLDLTQDRPPMQNRVVAVSVPSRQARRVLTVRAPNDVFQLCLPEEVWLGRATLGGALVVELALSRLHLSAVPRLCRGGSQ